MKNPANKQLFIFDLDGTLTESKDYLQAEMAEQLDLLLRKREIAVISGCSYKQIYEQFLTPFQTRLKRYDFYNEKMMKLSLLPTSGSSLYRWNRFDTIFQIVYRDEMSLREKAKILAAFDHAISVSKFSMPKAYGLVEEDRGSQITFSLLGQQAPLAKKAQFDPDFSKRKQIQILMGPLLPEFNVKLGGTTSIDITRKGIDKAYGVVNLLKHSKLKKKDAIFIGDAIFPGGNDWSVKGLGIDSVSVKNTNDTLEFIKEINRSK